ncbi:uncharacterized protein A4U43_C05F33500 [Asparagus officinalis]|uniref:Uncharacterized protein n=1 Tax=Asparagus officinalis TaxID=4686 RepID=A0A5P1EWE5_ASPOF|nr:uncharacterized protein A4U43_C05F33500 [Asparagus officinalis]
MELGSICVSRRSENNTMECEEMKNKGNASHKRPIVVNESVGSDDELSSEKKLKTNSRELVKNLLSRVMNDSREEIEDQFSRTCQESTLKSDERFLSSKVSILSRIYSQE